MDSLNYRAINITCVCVDTVRGGEIDGRIYHRFSEDPEEFRGVGEMLGMLDAFFDAINYPQAAVVTRSFRQKKGHAAPAVYLEPIVDWEAVSRRRGEAATFVVQVQSRQNASWQGAILWVERGAAQTFSSALEMLKLIDSSTAELEPRAET